MISTGTLDLDLDLEEGDGMNHDAASDAYAYNMRIANRYACTLLESLD